MINKNTNNRARNSLTDKLVEISSTKRLGVTTCSQSNGSLSNHHRRDHHPRVWTHSLNINKKHNIKQKRLIILSQMLKLKQTKIAIEFILKMIHWTLAFNQFLCEKLLISGVFLKFFKKIFNDFFACYLTVFTSQNYRQNIVSLS